MTRPNAFPCSCTHEAGDTDCAEHPTCNDCGEHLEGTRLFAYAEKLTATIATLTAERDAARAECERLRAATAWKPSEVWREEVADEVAEAIAQYIEAEAYERREEGLSYRGIELLAADIRANAWRKEGE